MLPVVGAVVDRSPHKKRHMAGFAWAGAASASLLFFLKDDDWQVGAIAVIFSSVLAGCSLVSYSAILVDISTEAERDRVSSRGLGVRLPGRRPAAGGQPRHVPRSRLDRPEQATWRCGSRCSRPLCGGPASRSSRSCGCATGRRSTRSTVTGSVFDRSFGQLCRTLKELRGLPDDADLPGGLPVLQRRHPDRHLRRVDLRREDAGVRRQRAHRHDPADPVRRLRRRAAVRAASRRGSAATGRSSTASSSGSSSSCSRSSCPRRTCRCSCSSRWPSASCSAAPRRCRARSSACSSPAAARASTSPSTTPASAVRRGSARSCSAWCSSSPTPTARRCWR